MYRLRLDETPVAKSSARECTSPSIRGSIHRGEEPYQCAERRKVVHNRSRRIHQQRPHVQLMQKGLQPGCLPHRGPATHTWEKPYPFRVWEGVWHSSGCRAAEDPPPLGKTSLWPGGPWVLPCTSHNPPIPLLTGHTLLSQVNSLSV